MKWKGRTFDWVHWRRRCVQRHSVRRRSWSLEGTTRGGPRGHRETWRWVGSQELRSSELPPDETAHPRRSRAHSGLSFCRRWQTGLLRPAGHPGSPRCRVPVYFPDAFCPRQDPHDADVVVGAPGASDLEGPDTGRCGRESWEDPNGREPQAVGNRLYLIKCKSLSGLARELRESFYPVRIFM